MAKPKSTLRVRVGGDPASARLATITKPRTAWALERLISVGERGCTAIDTPGPRWSGYVHELRHQHGIEVATIREPHGGEFPGHHARYVLRSAVTIIERTEDNRGQAGGVA